MPKGKKKQKNEAEYYRGEIRALKKENRHLTKRVKQLERYEKDQINDLMDVSIDEEMEGEDITIKKIDMCTSCGKGQLIYLDIIGRLFSTCPVCEERKKLR